MFGPWEGTAESAQRDSLITVQHTKFACGLVALGLRATHIVCDASGFLRLYQDLAKLYRAPKPGFDIEVTLAQAPCIESYMLDKIGSLSPKERAVALEYQPPRFSVIETNENQEQEHELIIPELILQLIVCRSILFSATELGLLKSRATPPDGDSWVFNFSALTAHLFQRVHKARLTYANSQNLLTVLLSEPSFLKIVNFAPILKLPPRFFPSSIVTPFLQISSGELTNKPLWYVSSAIDNLVHPASAEDVRRLGLWIAAQPHMRDIRFNFPFSAFSFMTSAWNKFPLYSGTELDAPPVFAGAAFIRTGMVDGFAYFLQPETPNGDIDIILSLGKFTWDYLNQDEDFR